MALGMRSASGAISETPASQASTGRHRFAVLTASYGIRVTIVICVLGIAALIALLFRGGGPGGRFTWPDRPAGTPPGSAGPPPSAAGRATGSRIVATRCETGASARCERCAVHKAIDGARRRALRPAS